MRGRKPYRIVVAEPYSSESVSLLKTVGDVTLLDNFSPNTLIGAVQNADALLVRVKTHITARIIEAAPRLKVIGRASPTMDHIDLRAARRRKIHVVYSPESSVSSAAEFTLALIQVLNRRIFLFDHELRAGHFNSLRRPKLHELGKQTVGLLGVDAVANKLAGILAETFGSKIVCHDPLGGGVPIDHAEQMTLDAFLKTADIVSVHLRPTEKTRLFVNDSLLARMKPTSVLINTSHGAVVDSLALAKALHNQSIAAAALDVFEVEPIPDQHPILRAPNCILTPHIAAATLDASSNRFSVADDVVRVLEGQSPKHPFID